MVLSVRIAIEGRRVPEGEEGNDDDIEDGWAGPLMDSNPVPGRGKDISPSPPSSSNVPPLAKSWPGASLSSKKSLSTSSSIPRES